MILIDWLHFKILFYFVHFRYFLKENIKFIFVFICWENIETLLLKCKRNSNFYIFFLCCLCLKLILFGCGGDVRLVCLPLVSYTVMTFDNIINKPWCSVITDGSDYNTKKNDCHKLDNIMMLAQFFQKKHLLWNKIKI